MSAVGYVVTESGGPGGTTAWADVTGKPATFPPSVHSHAYADITGKPSTFPPETHSHAYADITGKPSTFAPSAHEHETSEIAGLDAALASAPRVFVHDGSAYVLAPDADIFIGPADPGTMPAGSIWIDTDA